MAFMAAPASAQVCLPRTESNHSLLEDYSHLPIFPVVLMRIPRFSSPPTPTGKATAGISPTSNLDSVFSWTKTGMPIRHPQYNPSKSKLDSPHVGTTKYPPSDRILAGIVSSSSQWCWPLRSGDFADDGNRANNCASLPSGRSFVYPGSSRLGDHNDVFSSFECHGLP